MRQWRGSAVSIEGKKMPTVSVASARKAGAQVWDRNRNGLLDAGDRLTLPTLHRKPGGAVSKVVFEVTNESAQDFAWMLSSPDGFRLRRSARSFGDSKSFVNYFFAFRKGKIALDAVQTLTMKPDGSCTAEMDGPGESSPEPCSDFESSLFRPDAENSVNFIYENLLIGRHMKAVEELSRRQSEIAWTNATEGANLDIRQSYQDLELLFSEDAIETIDVLIGGLKNSGDHRRLRELTFYRSYLIGRWLAREAAPYYDMIEARLSSAEAVWIGKRVPFYEIDSLAASEKNPLIRYEILGLKAKIQEELFNPILRDREQLLFTAVSKFGVSYSEYLAGLRNVEGLDATISAANAFYARTDTLYKRLLDSEAKRWLGMKRQDMRRSDLIELFSFKGTERFFPPELMYPFLRETMEGLGLPLLPKSEGGCVTIDDKARPRKDQSPQTIAVSIPEDIRISFWPGGGVLEYEYLWHEIGHAQHYSNIQTPEWVFKHLGDRTAAESYAALFDGLVTDPHFIENYRSFVRRWNKGLPTDKMVPELSDADAGKIVKLGALRDLFRVRRFNYAKLLYEAGRVDWGGSSLNDGLDLHSSESRKQVYSDLLGAAYGVPLEPWDEARYLIDSEDDFYFLDYVRAFVIEPQIKSLLRKQFGEDWFTSPDAGAWLRSYFFSQGHFYTPSDLKNLFGFDYDDYSAFEQDFRWKLLAAFMLEKGKPLPERP